ncbi:acyl dehydratase [Virgibacillus natechei]|uniref:Acyl dehydratase n=1 Tax=Virgibacillus natechei TaxID=1216297 RepID=A0ABS4IJY8_9BACI|nr:MaoC/PaaZ C-terminal domain-containing protein [Virgibacillus natechei]MBP1971278.1 acyl dehydratase [Virgibacillus natechei]UZD12096.1 MaoC/PaaZ C-terminal domain-containing protein [Virgibacillus natechei]
MKFDEFSVGDIFFTNEVVMTKEEIIGFARKYDPQHLHMDEEAAEKTPYGSLIASGFHTLAVVWAEFIKMDILGADSVGGLGAEKIRWRAPVRPGDQLTGEFSIVNTKELSDKSRGVLSIEIVIRNQRNQEVLTAKTEVFVAT